MARPSIPSLCVLGLCLGLKNHDTAQCHRPFSVSFFDKDIPLFDSPSQPDLDVSFLQGREKQRLSGLCKDRGLVGEWN